MTQDTVEKYARELEPICKQADEYQKGHGYPVGTPAIELVKHVLKEVEKTAREEGARAERAKVVEWAADDRYGLDGAHEEYKRGMQDTLKGLLAHLSNK